MSLITIEHAKALVGIWVWREVANAQTGASQYVLKAEECILEIYPRPSYCDRGQWEMHALCPGYPKNPSPIDAADMFPRIYFMLQAAQAEGMLWMDKRKYTPLVETTEP